MGANYISEPVIFLVDTLFSLYITAIMVRFLLQWGGAGVNPYNPIAKVLIQITHPPLKLLRRFIPSIGKIDTAALVLALILQMVADVAIYYLSGNYISIGQLAVLAFTDLVSLTLNIFIFAIFASALLSWFNPGTFNAAAWVLTSLSEPPLRLCRQLLPDLGGVDFSPLAALILLQLAKFLILPPLNQLALMLS